MEEISKYKAIKEIIEGYLKAEEVSKILGISERQVYRIKGRVEEEGVSGVIHNHEG